MKRFCALLCLLLLLLTAACQLPSQPASGQEEPPPPPVEEPSQPPAPRYITSTLLVAGDAMSHMPQTNDALNCGGGTAYDYNPCLQYVAPYIEAADLAVVNLETVFRKDKGYSGFPAFNTPAALGQALKNAGFDLVTTANNHSYDQHFQGICDTLDQLDQMGLAHVGTYRSQEEFDLSMGVSVQDIGGISAAFLDYTYGLNGYRVDSKVDFCVNRFNVDYTDTLRQPDTEKLSRELAYAKSLGTDLVIVMMHWGVEYQLTANSYQQQMADYLIAQGADLVLGGHSHTPQPLEYRTVTTEDGSLRSGFVCYSLGNFLSNQQWEYSDITALLQLELQKDLESGKTTLSGVSYVPCLMLRRPAGITPRYYLLPAYEIMDDYDRGLSQDYITADVYRRLEKCVSDCRNIFGSQYDYRTPEG